MVGVVEDIVIRGDNGRPSQSSHATAFAAGLRPTTIRRLRSVITESARWADGRERVPFILHFDHSCHAEWGLFSRVIIARMTEFNGRKYVRSAIADDSRSRIGLAGHGLAAATCRKLYARQRAPARFAHN